MKKNIYYILIIIVILSAGCYIRLRGLTKYPSLNFEESLVINILNDNQQPDKYKEFYEKYFYHYLYYLMLDNFLIKKNNRSLFDFRFALVLIYLITYLLLHFALPSSFDRKTKLFIIYFFSFFTVYLAWTRIITVIYPHAIMLYVLILLIYNMGINKIIKWALIVPLSVLLFFTHVMNFLVIFPFYIFIIFRFFKDKKLKLMHIKRLILPVTVVSLIIIILIRYYYLGYFKIYILRGQNEHIYFKGILRYFFVFFETLNGNMVCRHFSGFFIRNHLLYYVTIALTVYVIYINIFKIKDKTDLDYISLLTFTILFIFSPIFKELFRNRGSFNHIYTHRYLINLTVPFSILLGRFISYSFSKKWFLKISAVVIVLYYPFIYSYFFVLPFEKYGGRFKTKGVYSWPLQSILTGLGYGEVQYINVHGNNPIELALKKIVNDNKEKKIILDDFYMSPVIQFYQNKLKTDIPVYENPKPKKVVWAYRLSEKIISRYSRKNVWVYIMSYDKKNYPLSNFLYLNFTRELIKKPFYTVFKNDKTALLNVYRIKLDSLFIK